MLTVSVDGRNASNWIKVTANHSLGQWQQITLQGRHYSAGPHVIGVVFKNEATGGTPATSRDLYVGNISYDGNVTTTGASITTATTAFITVNQPAPAAGNDTGGAAGRSGSLLPAGYLSTRGNQVIDSAGNPVRIASVGWDGTDTLTFAPYGLWQSSLQSNIDGIKSDGFNTVRIPWTDLLLTASPEFNSNYAAFNPSLDPELVGLNSMQMLDVLVADAAKDGLKVIFDHHDNNGGPGGWGGQQSNGLWIDSGPGTDGTDGSGTTGTVNAAKFLADSVTFAQHFAGNSTVIGFDLHNEPTSAGNINWGQGGPTDIQAMYTQVGNAIQAVDPGALIIAEGPEEWSGPAAGMPAGFGEGDLSGVAAHPVTLNTPNKVVYSVHEYPPDLSNNGFYPQAQQVAAMNAGWGAVETSNTAPVWIGEIGSNMTKPADQAWIQAVIDYADGKDGAQGGPTFSGNQQGVSTSWWQWGASPGQDPQGVETAWAGGTFYAAQQVATDQLLYRPKVVNGAVAITAASVTGPAQFLLPSNGSVLLAGSTVTPVANTKMLGTVSNLGASTSSGWSVELDTTDVLANASGGVLKALSGGGGYSISSAPGNAVLAPGGSASFTVMVASVTGDTAIAAHLRSA